MFHTNTNSNNSNCNSDNPILLPQLQKASLSLSLSTDLHQQEEEVVVEEEDEVPASSPEYRSVNMNHLMRSKHITPATRAVIDTPPSFLSSIPKPLPQSFVVSPPLSLPSPLPIPSKLVRSGASNSPNSSNKERTIHVVSSQHSSALPFPSTSPSPSPPHHRWIIRELQELPSDYSLVRTNVYVQQEADTPLLQPPQQVADRICQTLKSLSITIIHDDDDHYIDPNSSNVFADDDGAKKEENILLVETQYDVKFAIRLFSSKGNTMIVVEIRRTSGCTFEFRSAAKTLLRSVVAASTNTNAQQEQRTTVGGQGGGLTTTKRRKFTIPVSLPKRSQEEFHKCIEDDFNIAYKMIHSPNYETQVFGLESLEQMTRNKSEKSNDNDQIVKKVVARFVLLGKGGGGEDCDHDDCDDCLKQLLLLLDTTSTTTDQPSRTSHHHQSSFSSSLLRRKVFTVLANSLEAIHNSINNNTTPTTMCTTYSNNDRSLFFHQMNQLSFVSVLISTVLQETTTMTPRRRPHDVFQAVRCVRYLFLLITSSSSKGEEEDAVVRTAIMRKILHPTALDIISSYACGSNGDNGNDNGDDNDNDNDNDNGNNHHHHRHHHEALEQESSRLLVQLQQQKTLMMISS